MTDSAVSENSENHQTYFKPLLNEPLKGHGNDDVDGAAKGDVVEGVEPLGEEVSIDRTGLGEGPGKY